MLINKGGSITNQTEDGYTPIDIAEKKKHENAASYLKKMKSGGCGFLSCNWRQEFKYMIIIQ